LLEGILPLTIYCKFQLPEARIVEYAPPLSNLFKPSLVTPSHEDTFLLECFILKNSISSILAVKMDIMISNALLPTQTWSAGVKGNLQFYFTIIGI